MGKNKVKLHICGTDYTITSEDTYDYVVSIGEKVDKNLKDTLEKNPKVSTTMASILAALEYCDLAHKSATRLENLENQTKEYANELSHSKTQYETALSEVNHFKSKINELSLQTNRAEKLETQVKKYAAELVDLQNKYETASLELKESQNLIEDLTLKNKNEIDGLNSKNQAYERKIIALKEELETQKLNQPLSETITYSDSTFEIASPKAGALKSFPVSL